MMLPAVRHISLCAGMAANHHFSAYLMQNSQVLHQPENGRNPQTFVMHKSNARSEHEAASRYGEIPSLGRCHDRSAVAPSPGRDGL
jgi:hypothetical protein